MTVWTRLKEELDRAGRAAQGAFDEGKARLELMRTRQLADKAAQAIGYAVYRAKQEGKEIDADTYSRLSTTLSGHEADAARQEELLKTLRESKCAEATAEPAAEPPPAQ
jgi:hypothetical protein